MQVDADFFKQFTLAVILILTTSFASIAMAKEDAEEFPPKMAFLEFLGNWEAEDGEWIDPLLFESEQTGNIRIDSEAENSRILKKDKSNENQKNKKNAQTEEQGK